MKIAQLRQEIAKWEAAEDAVSKNKAYTIDGLSYTRQDLATIQKTIDSLYSRLACVMRGGSSFRASGIRPIDHIKTRWISR